MSFAHFSRGSCQLQFSDSPVSLPELTPRRVKMRPCNSIWFALQHFFQASGELSGGNGKGTGASLPWRNLKFDGRCLNTFLLAVSYTLSVKRTLSFVAGGGGSQCHINRSTKFQPCASPYRAAELGELVAVEARPLALKKSWPQVSLEAQLAPKKNLPEVSLEAQLLPPKKN